MKSLGLLGARLVLGGYLIVHGAQKLFGSFGGHGLEATSAGFESIGLRPGKAMAGLAGASELGGGLLTATGIAYPLGPVVLIGTMAIASATHRAKGPLMANGGYELPLTNVAVAAALAAAGPGKLRLGPNLSPRLVRRAVVIGALLGGASVYQLLNARPPEVPASVAESAADSEDAESGSTEAGSAEVSDGAESGSATVSDGAEDGSAADFVGAKSGSASLSED
jgi:putative oxidoreductase